ncbi:cobyrinate a,c-diamide synthase [Stenomitos frigidus]|uniref:Cobyrinate a,c-diamide synthase n=1 Tax=Stenomitos frigidus ULC18 TaxID=2107698 RepID=A0A2T1E6E5_9CYAN|nr:cobyrinate a,c-diamide synthase [Stenomitos frigidus]PSB28308.1 cobyrinic acid a,c-diamide synthase [Stenomitos frigidus ULC18]
MGLIVAGERSGVGKTTVTLALLAYLKRQDRQVQSFKVGPDYIDPMFHRYVTGRVCRNLDPMLTSEAYVQQCFDRHAQTATHALVEGVMGLFDGASGQAGFASTAHIARLLDLPILLVLNCSGMSDSIAALVHGYRSFDPRLKVAGVVLNRVSSDRHLSLLKSAIEPLNIPILGVLRRQDAITIPDRHLGLVPTAELANLNAVVDQLAHLGETCFDWAQLMPLLESQRSAVSGEQSAVSGQRSAVSGQQSAVSVVQSGSKLQQSAINDQNSKLTSVAAQSATQNSKLFLPFGKPKLRSRYAFLECRRLYKTLSTPAPRIAIAQDSAFSFYYADNLDLLEALGAELVVWSPMSDRALPDGIQGLYFGGGFPEVFAEQLAANDSARMAVRSAICSGIPTYAECGGLMYLCEQITNFEGQSFPMVGVLPTTAIMGKGLMLGYRRAIALQDSPILQKGAEIYGHEFHRSHLTQESPFPLFSLHPTPHTPHPTPHSSLPTPEGWHLPNLHASYVHLHWGTQPDIPDRFLKQCVAHAYALTRT